MFQYHHNDAVHATDFRRCWSLQTSHTFRQPPAEVLRAFTTNNTDRLLTATWPASAGTAQHNRRNTLRFVCADVPVSDTLMQSI